MKSGSGRTQTVVWLVEDHEDCRRMVARAVNRVEHLVCAHAFGRCEDVLAALEREPAPDVLLLDVGLPGMNGSRARGGSRPGRPRRRSSC
ncbi:MAG: response regulator [Verrucomicrobia bacterium]|nr:response regulator [Verrucomicrobiota bacterium]